MPDYATVLIKQSTVPLAWETLGFPLDDDDSLMRRSMLDLDPVFIGRDVIDLVDQAAGSIPASWSMHPVDIFTPGAFCWFEKPATFHFNRSTGEPWDLPVLGFVWRKTSDDRGLLFCSMVPGGDGSNINNVWIQPSIFLPFGAEIEAWEESWRAQENQAAGTSDMYFTEHQSMLGMFRLLAAFLAFSSGKIVRRSTARKLDRANTRRLQREEVGHRDLKVIQLRRYHQETKSRIDSASVNWRRRWVVGPFWRNQWFPSLQVHRPVWIAAYIKGPDGLPLDNPRKLFSVTR